MELMKYMLLFAISIGVEIMVRNYKRGNGKRQYAAFSNDNLQQAIAAVERGMSQAAASKRFDIPRITLRNKMMKMHQGKVGRPTVLTSNEETILVKTLGEISKWGYPLTAVDLKLIIKSYLDKTGKHESRFKNNMPGDDFVRGFMIRNGLSNRCAGNIKRARSQVGKQEVNDYFDNLKDVLENASPKNVYNFDETNVTDDPGCTKVIVPRGMRRVERVQEHSKMAISLMFCGNAEGELLPPFVVYKAQNCYENWMTSGPSGAKYDARTSGWFDMDTFQRWFFEIFLPHASLSPGKKVLVGDNLASHFSKEVVDAAVENDIHFTTLPPNSTHITQPLDVAVFRPVKRIWRDILFNWRRDSRKKGSIPKEIFPSLLSKLWKNMEKNIASNLKAGFKVTGLFPYNRQEVLKHLPDGEIPVDDPKNIGRALDETLVSLLKENRGHGSTQKRKRGKKITPGKLITAADLIVEDAPSTSRANTQTEDNATESASNDQPDYDDNTCSVCEVLFVTYKGKEWLQCVYCLKWVCGNCNGGEYSPTYGCPDCLE